MPWRTRYSDDGAEVFYSGHTTGAEILDAKRAFFTHGFDRPARYILCDFSEVERFDVSPHDVQAIVDQDLAALATHPDVLESVIAPTSLQFGLARMWQLRVEHFRPETLVARSRPEAVSWLDAHGVRITDPVERAHAS